MLGETARLTMGDFSFGVSYAGDVPEGESILVSVGHAGDGGDATFQTHYRSNVPNTDYFGFTGLQRLEIDGAELQWWCESFIPD